MLRRGFKKFTKAIALTALAAHAAFIEYDSRLPVTMRDIPDPLIIDNVETGDVILFARNWWNHHIPIAMMLSAYHYLHKTDYDHIGVVCINADGTPYLIERNVLGIISSTHLEQALMNSKAHQIATIPLQPRVDFDLKERARLFSAMTTKVTDTSSPSLAQALCSKFCQQWSIPLLQLSPNCPSSFVVLELLKLRGVHLEKINGEPGQAITVCDFLNHSLVNRKSSVQLDEGTIMIRMR